MTSVLEERGFDDDLVRTLELGEEVESIKQEDLLRATVGRCATTVIFDRAIVELDRDRIPREADEIAVPCGQIDAEIRWVAGTKRQF